MYCTMADTIMFINVLNSLYCSSHCSWYMAPKYVLMLGVLYHYLMHVVDIEHFCTTMMPDNRLISFRIVLSILTSAFALAYYS